MRESKLIYIASPYAGDIEKNVAFARRACRYAIHQGYIPIAVHLLYPQMLDDSDPAERELGLRLGQQLLRRCDELCASTAEAFKHGENLTPQRTIWPVLLTFSSWCRRGNLN